MKKKIFTDIFIKFEAKKKKNVKLLNEINVFLFMHAKWTDQQQTKFLGNIKKVFAKVVYENKNFISGNFF